MTIPGGPDYPSQLATAFLGKRVRARPSRICTATVRSSDGVYVTVDLDNLGAGDGASSYKARYERRVSVSGSTASWASPPPSGTRCVVIFPENENDYSPWAITFVGWP